jgi:hypothetical protein
MPSTSMLAPVSLMYHPLALAIAGLFEWTLFSPQPTNIADLYAFRIRAVRDL